MTISNPPYIANNYILPTNVKYGEVVYGLFAFEKSLPEDQIQDNLFNQISNKIK